ncbi:hypothetical protein FRC09_012865 [Ceratobasidium sp. 395]|nr:hypothetical protein FRC09_012865 [Ceratobasidium sp. 395]
MLRCFDCPLGPSAGHELDLRGVFADTGRRQGIGEPYINLDQSRSFLNLNPHHPAASNLLAGVPAVALSLFVTHIDVATMFYLLVLVTLFCLLSMTGVSVVSSTVLFLLSYPPILAILVLTLCVVVPSDDGHACEQLDQFGRLLPCYPAPPGLFEESKYVGRMCRAAERRRALRRLWRDVVYFGSKLGRLVPHVVSFVSVLVRGMYRHTRDGTLWLAPILASAVIRVAFALCASSLARYVAAKVCVGCTGGYLLVSLVAGLLLEGYEMPALDRVIGWLLLGVMAAWTFDCPAWADMKASGKVSELLAGIRAEMDAYEASVRVSGRRSKRAGRPRPQAQATHDKIQVATPTISSPLPTPTHQRAVQSRTYNSHSSLPSSSVSSPVSTAPRGSRRSVSRAIPSPATSTSSTKTRKAQRSERVLQSEAALVPTIGTTKKQESKSKVRGVLRRTFGSLLIVSTQTDNGKIQDKPKGNVDDNALAPTTALFAKKAVAISDATLKQATSSGDSQEKEGSVTSNRAVAPAVTPTTKTKEHIEVKTEDNVPKAAKEKAEDEPKTKESGADFTHDTKDPKTSAREAETFVAPAPPAGSTDLAEPSPLLAPATKFATQMQPAPTATSEVVSTAQNSAQTSTESPSQPTASPAEPPVELKSTPLAASAPAAEQPAPRNLTTGPSSDAIPASASLPLTSVDPPPTDQNTQLIHTSPSPGHGPIYNSMLKSLSHAASGRAMRMYAPVPCFQVKDATLGTRVGRAELKKKHAAKRAKLARRSMRLAVEAQGTAPVCQATSIEPSATTTAQSQPPVVPETPTPEPAEAGMDVCQPPSTETFGGSTTVCTNDGPSPVDQTMSPVEASPEVRPRAAEPPVAASCSIAPSPQAAAPSKKPPAAPRAPLSIPCKPVDGASFFKSYKPAPRPSPPSGTSKPSEPNVRSARTQGLEPMVPTSTAVGPSVSTPTPMERELLAAYKEAFGPGRSGMRTESDLDLGLAIAPMTSGACRQLGRAEEKRREVPRKNVVYTWDAQGKKRITAGEVKKREYVYKWNLDLGTPGVMMRAPKELWEGK